MAETRHEAENRPGERAAAGHSSGGFFILGAMLGAAIGALLGLLYAPRPGSETRQEWERKSEELRRRAEEAAEKAASRAEEFAERARQYAAKAEKAATLGRSGAAAPPSDTGTSSNAPPEGPS